MLRVVEGGDEGEPLQQAPHVSEATAGPSPGTRWGHVPLWLPTQATATFQNCTSGHTALPAWNQPAALVELRKKHPRFSARPRGLPSGAQLNPQPLHLRPSLGLCHAVGPASGTLHLLGLALRWLLPPHLLRPSRTDFPGLPASGTPPPSRPSYCPSRCPVTTSRALPPLKCASQARKSFLSQGQCLV